MTLDQGDEERAALALGLALSTYVAFLDFTEPIIRHGCAADVDPLIGSLLN